MKLKLEEVRSQKSEVRTLTLPGCAPTSDLRSLASERGMALVITLILLSVTLIMAVAFLAISRRERNAVTTTTDTATARLAADAALANAQAQIVAGIFATNNAAYNFGLLVSTNYINGVGFANNSANPTNVNYDYTTTGNPLTAAQLVQNIANLFYLPRVPVYLSNLVTHTVENRFYLDLNRNGLDDVNGWVTNVDNKHNPLGPDVLEVGDPEWIGLLERPDVPHGPQNPFVSRYAFIAVPVGNALDINAIHNQVFDENNPNSTVNPAPAGNGDNYFRNEGVGSWEINLAAFLADLNTNQWGQIIDPPLSPPNNYYQYNQPFNLANQGRAFDDARALLAYRYANNYGTLPSVFSLYGNNGRFAFRGDNVDGYSDGPLMTTFQLPGDVTFPAPNDAPVLPWAGAPNTNQFFTTQEFFDPAKTEQGAATPGFPDRLLATGTNMLGGNTVPTYDRYTFYRMLDELGSDSAPESGKINLNYSNAVVNFSFDAFGSAYPTNIAVAANAETNFFPWTAPGFFMAAADRMLRLYTTNWFQRDPSNYLVGYYGITNYYSYSYVSNLITYTVIDSPEGLGLTNIPFFGMTNQIPAFGVTNIPVWANGQFVYTPAVNRLLQLAANIYDAVNYASNYVAASGPYPGAFLPSVFRPYFNKFVTLTSTNVYICGFSEVTNLNVETDLPFSRPYNLANPVDLANLSPVVPNHINVFGVPMIIGAKKGLPNFNEFYMETAFQLTRKLMVTRQSTNVPAPAPNPTSSFWGYYVMYNLTLNNQFGVECWNSYRSNYMRPIDIYVTNFLVMTLTNDENNFSYTTNVVAGSVLSFPNATNADWPGYTNVYPYTQLSAGSFPVPLATNFAAVPTSRYLFNGGSPYLNTNLNLWYETAPNPFGQYPQPRWGLTMTNNLQVIMVDRGDPTDPRIIDYVQLSGPNSIRDLSREIMSLDTGTRYNGLWDTNQLNGIPNGFAWQFILSQASTYQEVNSYWSQRDPNSSYDQMNAFRAFTLGSQYSELTFPGYVPDQAVIGAATMTNAIQMAYYPTATVVQDIVWQANDPLVHYMAGDLVNPQESVFINSPFTWNNNYTYADNFATSPGSGFKATMHWPPDDLSWPGNMGKLNQRYQPWGGNPSTGVGTNLLAVKDPMVTCSDDWNFPTNKLPTVGWLGRVHRGTPWQTVFLKASDVLAYQSYFNVYGNNGPSLWVDWTGNVNPFDVTNTAPKQDRLLFDLFTTGFNDNATRGTLSVNQPHLAAWSALFSGIMVLSNSAVNPPISQTASSMTNYTAFPIPPAGPGTNSGTWQLWNGISQTRAIVSNYDGVVGTFEHVGDILVVPQLTERSPFLNWNNSVQQRSGISDEMYEWLPQQVMSLLREGSPRYVIYCYGQALRPAPNSLVTGGTYFGMCTNYQVVAESAARAVVRVDGAGTPAPHVVVESYNPLPPD